MGKPMIFDVNIGYGCNYRCTYCHEKYSNIGYKPVGMSHEVASRYSQYLHYMKSQYKDSELFVQFFGGEPLLYLDPIRTITRRASVAVNRFSIITNGSLVLSKKKEILGLSKSRSRLSVAVSYDFSLQEINRAKGSYDTVREAIRWLYSKGLLSKIITVIDVKSLPKFHEVFFDFIELKKELPDIKCKYNLSLYEDLDDFDEEGTIKSLKLISDFLRENPQYHGSFVHNVMGSGAIFEDGGGCASMVGTGITVEGDLFPDYSIPYRSEKWRNLTYQGNIFEDFSVLDNRRKEKLSMLNALPTPDKCRECESTCKINRWRFMLDGNDAVNSPPSDKVCDITKLVHSYMGEFR